MIEEVIGLMREEATGVHYEIALEELGDIIAGRLLPLARQRQVRLTTELKLAASLPNRIANLVTLILVNLIENAIEVTPAGKEVCLCASRTGSALIFEVRDQGPGFPKGTIAFAACHSTKDGGSGIGLALSKQLANHLGACLELKSTSAGCILSLSLPASLYLARLKESALSATR